MSIDRKLATRANNFNFIRLLAASVVLFSHSYPLTGSPAEFFAQYWGVDTGGGIGVAIFFTLSGFLVTRSLLFSQSPLRYIWARALRIFPALIGVILVSVLCFGPLFTALSPAEYFSHQQTLSYLQNVKLFPLQHTLPGVFTNNPSPAVNGSLWTLPVEVTMYGVLLLTFFLVKITRKTSLALCLLFFCGYFLGSYYFHLDWSNPGAIILPGINLFNFLKLGSLFFLGSAAYLYRSLLPLRPLYFFGATTICLLASHTGVLSFFAFAVTAAYMLLYLAFMPIDLNPLTNRLGDISYGIYIYAFPVQQAVIHLSGNSISPGGVTAIALPVTALFAYLSWHLLEKKVLQLKRIFPQPRPA